jgi:hypothetical protein
MSHRRHHQVLALAAALLLATASAHAATAGPRALPIQTDESGNVLMYCDDARGEAKVPGAGLYATGDYRMDAVLAGSKWSKTALTYSFHTESGLTPMSEGIKNNYRRIFAWMETLINLDFDEVGSTGDLQIWVSTSPTYAYAYYPPGGDIYLKNTYDNANYPNGFQCEPGSHGFTSLIHELGHALGLKHSFEGTVVLPSNEDRQTYTVMTYTFDSNEPASAMLYDVMALQNLYGARNHRSAASSYAFPTRIDQYAVGGETLYNPTRNAKHTIWDAGGLDVLDLSTLPAESRGYRFDLREGGFLIRALDLRTTGFVRGTALAFGAQFEDLVNSTSRDTIILGEAANVIRGYRPGLRTGHDVLMNGTMADVLDLSLFSPDSVTQHRVGDDLVIAMRDTGSSVTVKGYYGATPVQVDFESLAAGVDGGGAGVARLALVRPNPFGPSAGIEYTLQRGTRVKLEIFDLRGRRVRVLTDADEAAGRHTMPWDGVDESGRAAPSGVYVVRLAAAGESHSQRIVRVR